MNAIGLFWFIYHKYKYKCDYIVIIIFNKLFTWFGLDWTNFSFVISFQRADWRVRHKQGYMLDRKLRQEAGEGIKERFKDFRKKDGRVVVRAMRWNRVFYPLT